MPGHEQTAQTEHPPFLSLNGLSISLSTSSRGNINVVNSLDFDIQKGMIFGLAGESGCGKSITALSVMGLLPHNMHSEGSAVFKGQELVGLPEGRLRALRGKDISMVFQEPMTSLNPVLRVGYQIAEMLTAHMNLTKKDAYDMSVSLLRAVRIPSPEIRVREYPHQMSGGMRQRVMIAMAIACNPSLMIADEPTTALDVTIQSQILELIRGLRDDKGMSVLLITHDLGIIAENADAVAIMYAGRIVEHASVSELFERPSHPYTIGLMNSLPHGRGVRLNPIAGFVPKPGELPDGCKFSDRCDMVIPRCRVSEPAMTSLGGGDLAYPHLSRCIRAGEIYQK